MNFKTYKVKQGQYQGIVDSTITIPDGLKLITGGLSDIGHGKHDGLYHYLGILKCSIDDIYPELKGLHIDAREYGDYVVITIHDISFYDKYPYLITADELNSEFDFSEYFIITWSCYLKLMNMKKIVRINSESNIDILEVTNTDYLGNGSMIKLNPDKEELDLVLNRHFSFSDYAPMRYKVVKGEIAKDYWNTLIYNAIHPFDIPFNTRLVDLNKCYNLFESNDYSELDDYLNMKKANYLD
jgi:hypothetical protein